MAIAIKTEPKLIRPAGSHWLELEKGQRRGDEPFAKEELYPILEVDAPRVGLVRAEFEANRYVASSYDDATGTSSPLWSEWRIFLRAVRTPDPERPDLPHLGREAQGVGEATRRAISDACRPIIEAWLDSDAYRQSRRKTAAASVRREFDAPPSYRLTHARETLYRLADELGATETDHLATVLSLLEQAAEGARARAARVVTDAEIVAAWEIVLRALVVTSSLGVPAEAVEKVCRKALEDAGRPYDGPDYGAQLAQLKAAE
jgi:hypothetical protein